jgi:hypothetical protein
VAYHPAEFPPIAPDLTPPERTFYYTSSAIKKNSAPETQGLPLRSPGDQNPVGWLTTY